jgi:hypothetical protein
MNPAGRQPKRLCPFPFASRWRQSIFYPQRLASRSLFEKSFLVPPGCKGRLHRCVPWPYLRGYALRNAPRIRSFSLRLDRRPDSSNRLQDGINHREVHPNLSRAWAERIFSSNKEARRMLHPALSDYISRTDPRDQDGGMLAYVASLSKVSTVAPGVAKAIVRELADQRTNLKLIASENYCSLATQCAMGNLPRIYP